VVAGPGTGKTTILTLRIANILRQTDTPPNGILAITYTDAGVRAMREKLREVIGSRAHEVAIHTFHSFAAAMISDYPEHFLGMRDRRQMTDIEQESLVRTILAEPAFRDLRPLGMPDAYLSAILRTISDAKRDAISPEAVRANAREEIERVKGDESSISSRGATKGKLKADALERIEKLGRTIIFADAYERYEALKKEEKLRDFDDLITELLSALRTDELLLRLIQERFLYILVDEHQDTNDAQNLIVALIAEFFETPNIFVVGDEKQAIYRFQGASVENFLRLRKRWPTMELISLDTNYRSHQSILDASFAMIEQNYVDGEHDDLRIRLMSKSGGLARRLSVAVGENVPAMEDHLVQEIRAVREKEPDASVAVIVRRNRDLERVLRLLESEGLPVSSERSVDIFHHPIGAAFFDLLEFLVDPSRTDALAQTIIAGMWGLSFSASVELIRALKSGKTESLEQELPALARIRARMLEDGALGGIIEAAALSGLTALAAREPVFIHVWKGITVLAESLVRDGNLQSPSELMQALLLCRQSAESKTVKVSVGAPDLPLKAMTAHGSKGLEFDYVFIPYATDEAWIGRVRGASFILPGQSSESHDVRDIRRLFYVAVTRARTHVTILSAAEESDGKLLSPLRFIQELHPDHIEMVSLPRRGVEIPSRELAPQSRSRATLLADEAKRVLSEKGLSVTALNHFLECPSKFLYVSILKLPQAPHPLAEKGTAMHAAISKVWSLEERTPAAIEKTIKDVVSEQLKASLLPADEKEAVKDELIEAAPVVAAALSGHFATRNRVLSEHWVRTSFEGSHEGESVAIPIHGKLDAIIDSGSSLDIFDYKTKQGMSVAAIKGETKGSDGGYFRQLSFYRLLLQSDTLGRGKETSTSLVFVSPDDKGRCPIVTLPVEESDLQALRGNIQSLITSVWSGDIASARCGDPSCQWCGMKFL
jgi:DNA helicase II / ATP-dependent DNA helicase PcrA